MGNGLQFIDIILFAMIAAFLILRLRGVLGRRDGNESGYRDTFKADAPDNLADDNLVQLPNRPNDAKVHSIARRGGAELTSQTRAKGARCPKG